MKLKVAEGYQINHKGKMHHGGDTLEDVNQADSSRYVSAGWAEEVKESKADEPKSSPKKTTSKGDA